MESSTDLVHRADKARERLADRLENLRNQVTPATVMSDLMGSDRRAAQDIVPALLQQVRRNPMACALVAIGLGWLLLSDADPNFRTSVRTSGRRRSKPVTSRRRRSAKD